MSVKTLFVLASFSVFLLLSGCVGFDPLAFIMTPTATPTLSPTPVTPTLTPEPPSPTPSPTETFTETPPPPTSTATASETATLEPTVTDTATAGPSPTASRTPTNTRTPTRTRIPSRTPTETLTPTLTLTPTITNTPTPPFAVLRIERPGPFSMVTSPFTLGALVMPGRDGYVWLRLIGEDNRTIVEQKLDYRQYQDRSLRIAPLVNFSITAAVETARLELSIKDEYHRLIALSSVDLLLMLVGEDEIYPPDTIQERYLVRFPKPDATISGGNVPVIGLANPVNSNPVILELIDTQGNVVGSTQVQVPPPTGDLSHTPFEAVIPYQISESKQVRLTLRQESAGRIPGTVALSSLAITLEP